VRSRTDQTNKLAERQWTHEHLGDSKACRRPYPLGQRLRTGGTGGYCLCGSANRPRGVSATSFLPPTRPAGASLDPPVMVSAAPARPNQHLGRPPPVLQLQPGRDALAAHEPTSVSMKRTNKSWPDGRSISVVSTTVESPYPGQRVSDATNWDARLQPLRA